MADSSQNILVEFDYNNIMVIDPNKIIDENGKARERLVKHEELQMYANLECKVIPRTKLLLGASNANDLRTISTSSMNFLNPGNKEYIDNAYTDELTGKDTLKGEGVNQKNINRVGSPNKSSEYYFTQTVKSGKNIGATDNGLLGMKSIRIVFNTSFQPTVNITLEDVKGRALFESGNDSPYSAFFNLPYPMFYLTIKGFYGKAVKLPLYLQDFNSTYKAESGNFSIDLTFMTYKFSVLTDVFMAELIATPHMYKSNVNVTPRTQSNSTKKTSETLIVSYGLQKIKEVYSEYKSKGLIPKDFPEITLIQMVINLDNFIKNVLETFTKQNLDPIGDILIYNKKLSEFKGTVSEYATNSWKEKYMDINNYWVIDDNGKKEKLYLFKKEYSGATPNDVSEIQKNAINELKSILAIYDSELKSNPVLGRNGKYKINNVPYNSEIPFTVSYDDFVVTSVPSNNVDFNETYRVQIGQTIDDQKLRDLQIKFQNISTNPGRITDLNGRVLESFLFFRFTGTGSFLEKMNSVSKQVELKKQEIETKLTDALSDLIKNNKNELGFVPTIRNVLAVLYANTEGYLRLLEEVHSKAWQQRDSPIRKAAIFSKNTAGANPDVVSLDDKIKIPVYPWPQFISETSGDNGEERFIHKYPGDLDVINQTKAYLYDQWPEVEFIEEFTKGLTYKLYPADTNPTPNEVLESNRVTVNAIEFPSSNNILSNKEEVKYLFEIYERLILNSYYSKYSRATNSAFDLNNIIDSISNAEKVNIIESLGSGNPFIKDKLVNYGLNSANYLDILKQFSNQGVGESWQNFIRGVFNTSYIKNIVQNSANILFFPDSGISDVLGESINTNSVISVSSFDKQDEIEKYVTGSTNTNKTDFTDIYPFISQNWNKKNLAGNYIDNTIIPFFGTYSGTSTPPITQFYDTSKNLFYNRGLRSITNFTEYNLDKNPNLPKPFSGYNFKNFTPTSTSIQNGATPEFNLSDLKQFYNSRVTKYDSQLPTEGNLNYSSEPGRLPKFQTVSIINTPFFTNSIQEGVAKFRAFDEYPYVVPAYLFINSLPISTLREKYTQYSETTPQNSTQVQQNTDYLNYIFATLKKFGAIHKLPYAFVLKIGSVWHRYKKWVETGQDILDVSWKNFDYIGNFDPLTSASTTNYALSLQNNQNVDITLEKDSIVGTQLFTQINTGFYPQTINDFNVFYQGFRLMTGYTNIDVQSAITSGLTLINVPETNITMNFSGDPANPNRYLQLNAWSAYVIGLNKNSCYLMPSHGGLINQAKDECFENGKLKKELKSNNYLYDGSVRSFWNAPNYGYFALNKIIKPTPDSYMKKVFAGYKKQQNFLLSGLQPDTYTSIEELFSIFEKSVLDEFEKNFLSWSRSKYNYLDSNPNTNASEILYGNFQVLFTQLMTISPPTGTTSEQIIKNIQTKQNLSFSNTIQGFMNYDMIFKYGNPTNFNKNLFYTFSNKNIEDALVFKNYNTETPNALPSSSGTQTLVNSKLFYPKAWEALLKNVGFSTATGLTYSNSGSYIFDFFIDFNIAFTPENVELLSPIIKLYATQKFLKKNTNADVFKNLMTSYIDSCDSFVSKTLNLLLQKAVKELDQVQISKPNEIVEVSKGDQTKIELWDKLKAINDKWISGDDFKGRTLFEDILFLDRANRDVGNKIVVDIYKLRGLFYDGQGQISINPKMSVFSYTNSILDLSNLYAINYPSYVNFYGVPDSTKTPIPKPEGSLEMANTMFGTFLSVDYKDSRSKMLCFYKNVPSVQLDTKGLVEGYKNDSFDIRRASDNPLVENQTNKVDWANSNKVIGFSVDIGPQNQGVFNSITLSQKNSTPTEESLKILSEMSTQAGNRGYYTQNISLYDLYKIRSYDCEVTMLGNALIQPLMYFNLRNVPLFNGAYMITEVSHDIGIGVYYTKVKGTRQPISALPVEVDFLQSLRENLVQNIIQKKEQDIQSQINNTTTNPVSEKDKIYLQNDGTNEVNDNLECSAVTKYKDFSFTSGTGATKTTTIDPRPLKQKIQEVYLNSFSSNGLISQSDYDKLKYAVFAQFYLQSFDLNFFQFKATLNNYIGADISVDWGSAKEYFDPRKLYFCNKREIKTSFTGNTNYEVLPYVVFESVEKNIELLFSRYRGRASLLINPKDKTQLAQFIITNSKPNSPKLNTWIALDENRKRSILNKVADAIGLYETS